jgi:hypothetical protein
MLLFKCDFVNYNIILRNCFVATPAPQGIGYLMPYTFVTSYMCSTYIYIYIFFFKYKFHSTKRLQNIKGEEWGPNNKSKFEKLVPK